MRVAEGTGLAFVQLALQSSRQIGEKGNLFLKREHSVAVLFLQRKVIFERERERLEEEVFMAEGMLHFSCCGSMRKESESERKYVCIKVLCQFTSQSS
jgi:hypothetical protein